MAEFVTKPKVVFAERWTGSNEKEMASFLRIEVQVHGESLCFPGRCYEHTIPLNNWVVMDDSGIWDCDNDEFFELHEEVPF